MGKKDILYFHAFCKCNISTGGHMCSIGVVDGQISVLPEVIECILKISFNHLGGNIVESPVNKVSNRKTLAGSLRRVRARARVIWFFSESVLA